MTAAWTLTELLTRRVPLHWYEAIAIVRGVTEHLRELEAAGSSVPELHQIALTADGAVTVAGGFVSAEPVRRLGQLLQATLPDTDVPVQLRLVVSQATAPIPSYATAVEFDQALAYFDRPDRARLLGALFARAEAAGRVPDDGNVGLTLDGVAPLPANSSVSSAAHQRQTFWRRAIGPAIVLVCALAVVATVAAYLRGSGLSPRRAQVSRAAATAGDAVASTILAGASAVSDTVGLGRLVPANAATSAVAPSVVAAIRPQTARPRTSAGRSAPPRLRTVAATASTIAVREGEPVVVDGVMYVANPVPEQPFAGDMAPAGRVSIYEEPGPHASVDRRATRPADAADAEPPRASRIYAAGTAGVLPAIAVSPRLPRHLPPNGDISRLSRIELIIARDGSVESARLLGGRPDVLGGMFLSAAKAWQFEPATRGGLPVRFRKTILVSFE